MGLFGNFSFNEPPKKEPTLIQMAKNLFGTDTKLMLEIENYLASRRQQHNMPTKISWKMQLEILQEIPEQDRANEVRNCTIKGYRQIAYKKDKVQQNVSRAKKEIHIVNQGF